MRKLLVPVPVVIALVGTTATAGHGAIRAYDLVRQPGIEIIGAHYVGAAADVNGDGAPDLLVGEGYSEFEPEANQHGRVYVVFGRSDAENGEIVLDQPGFGGFVIEGADRGDHAGSARGVGDVNGDGLDDIAVSARGADNNARRDSGTAYIVFGKKSESRVDLLLFDLNLHGALGYRIDGAGEANVAGSQVAPAGDANSDGLADVVVSAPWRGASYVVFGKRDPLPVDLRTFHLPGGSMGRGYRIDTPSPNDISYYGVDGGRDVNGDGVPDIVIGVFKTNWKLRGAWVVFGKSNGAPVDIFNLGDGGYRVRGWIVPPVSMLGDVNGDGLSDLSIHDGCSTTYVLFGRKATTELRLKRLADKGYRIAASDCDRHIGHSSAALGDVNGDGPPDLLLGSWGDFNGPGSHSAYVVFTRPRANDIRLDSVGEKRAYRLDGRPHDGAANTVAGPGDVNGDGTPDILVGASRGYKEDAHAYLVWGHP